jgi:AraC-like DNA-binding protein
MSPWNRLWSIGGVRHWPYCLSAIQRIACKQIVELGLPSCESTAAEPSSFPVSSITPFPPIEFDHGGTSLQGFRVADSHDVDESPLQTAPFFGEIRLQRLRRDDVFHGTLDCVPMGPVSFNRTRWGARVSLQPLSEALQGYYLVSLPTRGAAQVRQGSELHQLAAQSPGVFSPVRAFSMEVHEGYDQLLIRVDSSLIADAWQGLTGRPLTAPLVFDMPLPARPQLTQAWHGIVALAGMASALPLAGKARRFAQASLADALASLLLTQHAHSQQSTLHADATCTPSMRVVRQAEELMLRRLRAHVSVNDLCIECSVSRRTLFAAFHSCHGVGPMTWLRERRLEAARSALQKPSRGGIRVADIALEYGFTHVGDFAGAYRRQFGEAPSQTLRRGWANA